MTQPCKLTLRIALLSAWLLLGCAADSGAGDAGPLDASVRDASSCESRRAAYTAFVNAHSACSVDSDCVVVGACAVDNDIQVVQASAASEARRLSSGRCLPPYEGHGIRARCLDGRCGRVRLSPVPNLYCMFCEATFSDAGDCQPISDEASSNAGD